MKKYTCPYCFVQLNIDGQIVLVAEFSHHQRGLILLSDKLGDYSIKLSPDIYMEMGDKADFYCPSCHKSLEYAKNKDFVRLVKTNKKGKEFSVVFSAIFGEHCTYKVSEERTLTYGESALKYQNPEWFLQEENI